MFVMIKRNARIVLMMLACVQLLACAPMDLVGTLESSCKSALPPGDWTRLDGLDYSVEMKLVDHYQSAGDQLSISYISDEGLSALCAAHNGGFFPKAGWLFVLDENGQVSEFTID
jgi:hypothetical protein